MKIFLAILGHLASVGLIIYAVIAVIISINGETIDTGLLILGIASGLLGIGLAFLMHALTGGSILSILSLFDDVF